MLLQVVPKEGEKQEVYGGVEKSRKACRRTGRTRRPCNLTETCLSAFPSQRYTKVPSHRNFHWVVSEYSFPEAVCSPLSCVKVVCVQHNNTNHRHKPSSWWQQDCSYTNKGCKTSWYTHWKCGVVVVIGIRTNQDYVQYVTPTWWYIFYSVTAVGKNCDFGNYGTEMRWGEQQSWVWQVAPRQTFELVNWAPDITMSFGKHLRTL